MYYCPLDCIHPTLTALPKYQDSVLVGKNWLGGKKCEKGTPSYQTLIGKMSSMLRFAMIYY